MNRVWTKLIITNYSPQNFLETVRSFTDVFINERGSFEGTGLLAFPSLHVTISLFHCTLWRASYFEADARSSPRNIHFSAWVSLSRMRNGPWIDFSYDQWWKRKKEEEDENGKEKKEWTLKGMKRMCVCLFIWIEWNESMRRKERSRESNEKCSWSVNLSDHLKSFWSLRILNVLWHQVFWIFYYYDHCNENYSFYLEYIIREIM